MKIRINLKIRGHLLFLKTSNKNYCQWQLELSGNGELFEKLTC